MATDWAAWQQKPQPPAISKITVLQTTWTDCPVEIQEVIGHMWRDRELGNDHHIIKTSLIDLSELISEGPHMVNAYNSKKGVREDIEINYQLLLDYLEKNLGPDAKADEEIWLHLWW